MKQQTTSSRKGSNINNNIVSGNYEYLSPQFDGQLEKLETVQKIDERLEKMKEEEEES